MQTLTIAQTCEQTGLSPRTVRYYEELGLLPGVRRTEGGRRAYGPDELERLAFIQRLKNFGLSLSEIKELNAIYGIHESTKVMLEHLDQVLATHLGELDARIRELGTLRDDMSKYRDHVGERIDSLHSRKSRSKGKNR